MFYLASNERKKGKAISHIEPFQGFSCICTCLNPVAQAFLLADCADLVCRLHVIFFLVVLHASYHDNDTPPVNSLIGKIDDLRARCDPCALHVWCDDVGDGKLSIVFVFAT
jgi:hypothetical protein